MSPAQCYLTMAVVTDLLKVKIIKPSCSTLAPPLVLVKKGWLCENVHGLPQAKYTHQKWRISPPKNWPCFGSVEREHVLLDVGACIGGSIRPR